MALFTDQIDRFVCQDPYAGKYFLGTFAADQLPFESRSPFGLVVNLDNSDQEGSHWCSIWVDSNKNASYFDSFGRAPIGPSINAFMDQYLWDFNNKVFQHYASEYCGFYAILFLLLTSRGYNLQDVQYLFYHNKGEINDVIVHDYIKYFTLRFPSHYNFKF